MTGGSANYVVIVHVACSWDCCCGRRAAVSAVKGAEYFRLPELRFEHMKISSY